MPCFLLWHVNNCNNWECLRLDFLLYSICLMHKLWSHIMTSYSHFFHNASKTSKTTLVRCCLRAHGTAVFFILVGGDHLAHVDADGGQDAVQILQDLVGHGGLSAQDPAQLHAEQAEVGAAIDQGVTLIVGREHPVGARRSWSERGERQRCLVDRPCLEHWTNLKVIKKVTHFRRRKPRAWQAQQGSWL